MRAGNHGYLRLALYERKGEQETLRAELVEPVDVEGQLRELSLDRATYDLNSTRPTLAVLVKSRNRGEQYDQYLSDLQLYILKEKALQRVATVQVAHESSGTNCDTDCQDSVSSKTLVILGKPGALGYRELILRTRTLTTSQGKGKPVQNQQEVRLSWNGQAYE